MSTIDSPANADNELFPEWEGEAPTNYQHFREMIARAMEGANVSQKTISEVIETTDTAVVDNEEDLEWENDLPDIQAELKRGTEGVSVSLYELTREEPVKLLDEAWWTWAEFTGINTTSLPISAGGTTVLEPPEYNQPPEGNDTTDPETNTGTGSTSSKDEELQYHIDLDSPSVEKMAAMFDKVDEILENTDLDTEVPDPFIVVAGDPPNYNDRLPYNICEEYESDLGFQFVAYTPRAWEFLDNGSLVLHDGTLGATEDGEAEFEVRVDPEDLIGYWAV